MKRYQVKVIPRASRNEVMEIAPGELKVKLTAPPVEGKANELLIEVLAKYFGVKKRTVEIISGQGSRHKVVTIKSS